MKYNTENIKVGDIVFARGGSFAMNKKLEYSVMTKLSSASLVLYHNGPTDNFKTVVDYADIISCPGSDDRLFGKIVRALKVI